jgi:hypothetical protein
MEGVFVKEALSPLLKDPLLKDGRLFEKGLGI